jgi:hypothetical protein
VNVTELAEHLAAKRDLGKGKAKHIMKTAS